MKNNSNVINKKESVDFEKLINTEFDNSPMGYYFESESGGDAHTKFVGSSVKVGDFNSVLLETLGQGNKVRIENDAKGTESLLKSITAQSLKTPIVIDFCKNAGNIQDGVYIGRVETDSPVEFIAYIKDDQKYNMPIGTLGEGRAVKK